MKSYATHLYALCVSFASSASLADSSHEPLRARDDEILVRARDHAVAERVAAEIGAVIDRASPYTNAVVFRVPSGSAEWLAEAVRTRPGVTAAYPHPVFFGAGKSGSQKTSGVTEASLTSTVPSLAIYQWQHDLEGTKDAWSEAPTLGAGIVIAVLDTGVSPTPSLPATALLGGVNTLNPAASAADDNGHGTHMATIAAARGALRGVAPAATVLPIKVLDSQRCGTELALVDGLYQAVATPGVKVINLSLAFPVGYAPSDLLAAAVEYAVSKDVVVVAASGNDGAPAVAFPAALPGVIAVGAGELSPSAFGGEPYIGRAPYSNYSGRLDVIAIGGVLDRDLSGDGLPDGILGEQVLGGVAGVYYTCGTSPAAASVSGLAALLVGKGVPAQFVGTKIRQTATDVTSRGVGFDPFTGAGLVHGGRALTTSVASSPAVDVYVAPRLVNAQTKTWDGYALFVPVADIEVRLPSGKPLAGASAFVHFGGAMEQTVKVVTDSNGRATAMPIPTISPTDAFVSVHVQAVVNSSGQVSRPTLVTAFDELTFRLLSNLAYGLGARFIALDPISDAETPASETNFGTVFRPLGTGLTTSGYVYLVGPRYFIDSGFAQETMLLSARGTGLTTSAIVLDTQYFDANYLTTYKPTTLTLRNMTLGTGLTTSAIVWNGRTYPSTYFQTSGTLSVMTTTLGTGLTTSGFIFTSTYFNSTLYSTKQLSSSTTLVAMSLTPFNQDVANELGVDYEEWSATYAGATVPGDLGLTTQYNELEIHDGVAKEASPGEPRHFDSGDLKAFQLPL